MRSRYVENAVLTLRGIIIDSTRFGVFPITDGDDWCGEHEPIEEERTP